MAADLSGRRLKLTRAKQDLDALSDKVATYMDPPPFRFVTEGDGTSQAIICRIDREPDLEWGIDVGAVAF